MSLIIIVEEIDPYCERRLYFKEFIINVKGLILPSFIFQNKYGMASLQNDILFSIVIPTYNRASMIFETLESVFSQTYSNYEVIVVDNSSTDNTEEILQPLILQNKIRYIRNARNFERAYSRNVGLENAKGDFLTLLDSDDFMYTDCLTDACHFIKENPALKIFHNKFEIVNQKRETIYRTSFPPLSNQYKALCWGNFMSAIGGFIHKEIYSTFRFNLDPKMIGSEDYEYWFHVFARYKVGRINKINSGVREHPNRSVNIDAYNDLDYQCSTMLRTINNDPVLKNKFGKYTGRLSASYKLQEIIANYKKYSIQRKLGLLAKAAENDGTIIFTKRYLATFINIFK
jgi:glycosyltransferase involved in cell wall biosynthesis